MNKKLSRLFSPGLGVFAAVLAVFCLLSWVFRHRILALFELAVSLGVLGYYQYSASRRKKAVARYLKDACFSVDSVSKHRMTLPMPAAILSLSNGAIMWCNEEFRKLTGATDDLFETPITDFFPEFPTDWLGQGQTQCPTDLRCGTHRCRVYGNMIRTRGDSQSYPAAMVYFVDQTELLTIRDDFEDSRTVVGIILVDNYDELTSSIPDRSVSAISAKLDDAITAWATGGILRRLERNRYLYLFEHRELARLIADKFSILDTVHEITNDYGTPATLTIGLGKDGQNLVENYDFASLGVEMSLSRGGDQAVIKDRYNFAFYGGRAQEAERRTKVKSRVMAGSLSELISQSSDVYIMGHKNADLDAVGSAAGVMAICRKLGVPAKIYIDLMHNASQALLEKLQTRKEYAGRFVFGPDVLSRVGPNTLLVVVDTNRPDQVESRELLKACPRVAVIDHHRRAADYIEDATLNFHEPYASSASELLTELIQYLLEREDLLPEELMALLSGIVLDTKNFTVRTGTRTFEAAAWLRKNGADTVAVKLLFQNDLSSTLTRYEILQHAELYRGDIALCQLSHAYDRIIAAQAADELLSISGIQASFVYYPDGDRVICSGRSIGEANVQMILEPLGGGGNQATAGAQIKGMTPEQVTEALKRSIDAFFD